MGRLSTRSTVSKHWATRCMVAPKPIQPTELQLVLYVWRRELKNTSHRVALDHSVGGHLRDLLKIAIVSFREVETRRKFERTLLCLVHKNIQPRDKKLIP